MANHCSRSKLNCGVEKVYGVFVFFVFRDCASVCVQCFQLVSPSSIQHPSSEQARFNLPQDAFLCHIVHLISTSDGGLARAAKRLALFGRAGIEVLQLPVRCAAFPGQNPESL